MVEHKPLPDYLVRALLERYPWLRDAHSIGESRE